MSALQPLFLEIQLSLEHCSTTLSEYTLNVLTGHHAGSLAPPNGFGFGVTPSEDRALSALRFSVLPGQGIGFL